MSSRCLRILAAFVCMAPLVAFSSICEQLEGQDQFDEKDRITSDYFSDYFISKRNDVYFVLAVKRVSADADQSMDVLDDLERHAEFLPNYNQICVLRLKAGEVYTGIRFQAWIFESRFTNSVEISRSRTNYRQCWNQIRRDDRMIVEKYQSAPTANQGYWRIQTIDGKNIELRYFAIIQPPIEVPLLYYHTLKNTYEKVFQAVLDRIHDSSKHTDTGQNSPECAQLQRTRPEEK